MTAQEQQLLQGLTDRISKTPLDEKDPEAEQYLQQTLGRNPDALYILAQTVLVQQYALDNAQKQLADLRTQLDEAQQQLTEARQHAQPAAPPKHTSFLGNLLGMKDDDTPPPPQQTQYAPVQTNPRPGSFASNQQYGAPPPAPYAQPQYAPQYGAAQYAPPQYGAPQYGTPSQGGSFLRSAATTAAGVAAGAIAFEGIESLVHGFEHNGGQSVGSFGGSQAPREEVINNYYGDSSPSEHHSDHLSPDIEDRRNDTRQFAGSADNTPIQDDDNNDFSDNTPAQDDDNNDFADTSSNDDYSSNDDNNDFNS